MSRKDRDSAASYLMCLTSLATGAGIGYALAGHLAYFLAAGGVLLIGGGISYAIAPAALSDKPGEG